MTVGIFKRPRVFLSSKVLYDMDVQLYGFSGRVSNLKCCISEVEVKAVFERTSIKLLSCWNEVFSLVPFET